jgi:hypothetical protein
MDSEQFQTMVQGANVLACLAIATFFLRSWRRSADAFFMLFAAAFGVFAVNRFIVAVADDRDDALVVYLVRLFATLLIVAAIVQKNRQRT